MKRFVLLALALFAIGGFASAQTAPGIRTINHTGKRASITIGGFSPTNVASGWLAPHSHREWPFVGNAIEATVGDARISIKLKAACPPPQVHAVELVENASGFAWRDLGCVL